MQSVTGQRAVDLSEFLQEDVLGWDYETLFDETVIGLPEGGELLVDIFVAPKENTSRMNARTVYSSSDKRVLQGQEYVVLTWTKETLTQVVGFREVIPGKHFEQVDEMLRHLLSLGLQMKRVQADGAYFKSGFCRYLNTLALELISKPRRDSWWWHGNERIQLKKWASSLPVESFHYYPKQKVYARSFVMSRHDCKPCRIVVIRPKRSCEAQRMLFYLSTDPHLTTQEIIAGYRRRWRIETVFRDCNQNLGLKAHQGFSQTSVRHVAMVFLNYNILAQLKAQMGKTIGRLIKMFQQGLNPIQTMLSG